MTEDPERRASTADPRARFVGGQVERASRLTRAEFAYGVQRRKPFVIAGAAAHSTAVRLWDPEHLIARAGAARLELLAHVYEPAEKRAGYPRTRRVATTLAEWVHALLGAGPELGYVFNNESSVLLTNPGRAEFHVGWGDQANPGLAPLAAEFELPELLPAADLIHAFVVLGGPHHAAPVHYDLGGEAKFLVQIRGRKRVLLFPPAEAGRLYFPAWLEEAPPPYRVPHAAEVDLEHPDLARHPELAHARALEAVLEPGDVLYWPAFWPHEVTNLDPFTLAVSCAFEEVFTSCMTMREELGLLGQLFVRAIEEHGASATARGELLAAFRHVEGLVLSERFRRLVTMYGWHGAIQQHAKPGY